MPGLPGFGRATEERKEKEYALLPIASGLFAIPQEAGSSSKNLIAIFYPLEYLLNKNF